jgi:preprotein translocase subunit SecE
MTTDEREDEKAAPGDDENAESGDDGGTPMSEGALQAEAMASAPERSEESDARDEADDAPAAGVMGTRGFGIDRYIQGAFAVLALVLFWVLQQSIVLAWNLFTEPNVLVATAVAAVAAIGGALALYRHERFSVLAREIAVELSKVTWPTREEAQVSTVVVIVTSVVAAVYLGVFDALWSAITDLLYTA